MDLDRFRKVLGMLGSDQPGERSAAALKATEMLKESGVDWSAVSVVQSSAQPSSDAGDVNVLIRTLEERNDLRQALSTERIRVRLLEADLSALRQQIYEMSQPKVEEEPAPAPRRHRKRPSGFFPWDS